MDPSFVLYHTLDTEDILEWGTRYYVSDTGGTAQAKAEELVAAEAPLCSWHVLFTRWEHFNTAGAKDDEGTFGLAAGTASGNMLPIHYALFIRLNSPGVLRPSSKYIHGYTEEDIDAGGATATLVGKVATYGAALVAASVSDNGGVNVTGTTLRGFSRRKRMRRKTA